MREYGRKRLWPYFEALSPYVSGGRNSERPHSQQPFSALEIGQGAYVYQNIV
jgi:hypothetical protein